MELCLGIVTIVIRSGFQLRGLAGFRILCVTGPEALRAVRGLISSQRIKEAKEQRRHRVTELRSAFRVSYEVEHAGGFWRSGGAEVSVTNWEGFFFAVS
jgi:hypothetical protein